MVRITVDNCDAYCEAEAAGVSRLRRRARRYRTWRPRGSGVMIVLKLGGSLANSGSLPRCLAALAATHRPAVIVPGGGVFADAARAAQPRLGFSDRTAHHMAILAMEQYALVLIERLPRLRPCRSIAEMRRAAAAGDPAIWLPTTLALADATIPH